MIFKLIFGGLTASAMFYFLVHLRRTAVQRLFVLGAFGAALVVIAWPELTMRLAHAVGVGRGADLVIYLSMLFLLCLCMNFYARFKDIEEWQARLVRALALRDPVRLEDGRRTG